MAKDLRTYLAQLEQLMPEDIVHVEREINPKFEITAVTQHLENEGKFPLIIFDKVKNLKGELSDFKVLTNLFGTRQKVAVALDLQPDQWRMETSLAFAERATQRFKPVVVSRQEAPVKEVIYTGEDVDLLKLPVVTHHEMDGFPYLVDAVIAADPETGVAYNSSHHRQLIRDKNTMGIWMSPRHLWNYHQRAAKLGKPLPFAHVHGHHPGFFLGSEVLAGMEEDEYEIIGGIIGEPLRLVPSETFGERLMVPADAEIVIEGEMLPDLRDAEGPFGEFTGYYGPQRWGPVCRVTAITHRKDPIYVNILVGHPDTSILGGIPKEASVYNEVRKVVPTVKAVHFPISGTCRFNANIALEQLVDGEANVAAMAAFPWHDELKTVFVVDDDVDIYSDREVLWALATRVQPDMDLNIISNVRGGSLDPSSIRHANGSKLIINATRPVDRPYAERIRVPREVMERIDLKEWIK